MRFLRRWLLLLVFGGGLSLGLYGLYLDQVVKARFEGKRWAVPARVYARPLELFAGKPLTSADLEEELKLLGYERKRQADRPGAYSQGQDRLLLRTRGFRFWDGEEPPRHLDIRFSGERIADLRDADGGPEPGVARLDPALIASIYPAHQEDRVLVRRGELPDLLVAALVAVEDRHYFEHSGVDPRGILRALWSNLRAGRVVQGGSTLTQQLVKNFFLTSERSIWRKANEALMALSLEWRYSKDEILEAYANEIYLGQDGPRAIHGFALASLFLFNRPLAELDLPQTALLVGMIRGPSLYDPRRNPERARERRDLVLDTLAEQALIDPRVAEAAKKAGLGVSAHGGRPTGRYPAFMDLVRRQLHRDYREEDLRSEGLSIFTTLDPLVQARAEEAVSTRLERLEKSPKSSTLEAAAVVSDVDNGEVMALVGGRRPQYEGFNRALDAVRQIGSLVKPVVYLEALSRPGSYSLTSPVEDTPIEIRGGDGKMWRPGNYDGGSHGRVPLYKALAHSYNLATVRVGLDVGVERVARRLEDLGVEREVMRVPSLLLGTLSLTPLEVTQVYQGFASGGFRMPLRAVREVLDANGQPLGRYPLEVKQAVDPGPVYLLNWALRRVVEEGTGRSLANQLPAGLRVAGKTGTTDDYRDSWFAGFSGDKVAVVWVGRDDNKPAGLSGAAGAMKVWGDIIAGSRSTSLDLPVPAGIETFAPASDNGFLGGGDCAGSATVPYLAGSAPRDATACGGGNGQAPEQEAYRESLAPGRAPDAPGPGLQRRPPERRPADPPDLSDFLKEIL